MFLPGLLASDSLQRAREAQLVSQLEEASRARIALQEAETAERARMLAQLEQQRQEEASVRLRLAAAEQVCMAQVSVLGFGDRALGC